MRRTLDSVPLPRPTASTVRRLALASVVANSLLVVTGGAVRLTASGLGCPTWPRCTDASYVNTAEYGVHGYIEFGNRLLTFVLTGVVIALVVAACARAAAPAGLSCGSPCSARSASPRRRCWAASPCSPGSTRGP